jgi:hypothetical protein
LDATEIWIQIQQSLWERTELDRNKEWKLQFPLAIDPTRRIFVVLRTAFTLRIVSSQQVKVNSFMIPIEFHDGFWNYEAEKYNSISLNGDTRQPTLCLYWLTFSQDDSFLSFAARYKQGPLEINVLKLNSDGDITMEIIRSTVFNIGSYRTIAEGFQLVFHQTIHALAITFNERAYIWEFVSCKFA